jgi:hypothetical protein
MCAPRRDALLHSLSELHEREVDCVGVEHELQRSPVSLLTSGAASTHAPQTLGMDLFSISSRSRCNASATSLRLSLITTLHLTRVIQYTDRTGRVSRGPRRRAVPQPRTRLMVGAAELAPLVDNRLDVRRSPPLDAVAPCGDALLLASIVLVRACVGARALAVSSTERAGQRGACPWCTCTWAQRQ